MKFFQVYQYMGPAILFPLSYWLWWQRYDGDHRMVLILLSLPITFAYIVPAVGTNWLRLWEFDTRFRLGRFRPHHGLVFGSATSCFALLALAFPGEATWIGVLRSGFVLGSVLAFWNWLYDSHAIKSGFIKVYTRPRFKKSQAESIATDYAPALFGSFGVCYGMSIRCMEKLLFDGQHWELAWPLLLFCQLCCLFVPVLVYVLVSYVRRGESGLRSYERVGHEA